MLVVGGLKLGGIRIEEKCSFGRCSETGRFLRSPDRKLTEEADDAMLDVDTLRA